MRFTILFTAVLFAGFLASAAEQRPATNPIASAYGESEFKLGTNDVIRVYG